MAGEVEREDRKTTFHWKLKFSSLGDRVTNYSDSPGFLFGGRNWLLNIFPNTGNGNRSDGYVVLGVLVWDLEPARDVRYSVGIRTAKGETKVLASGTKTFDSRYNGVRVVLMERSELLRRSDELLPQDTLTFTVTLELEDGSSETGPSWLKSCDTGCWGEGPHNCQLFSNISCSPQCNQDGCFGPEPRQCCHPFSAGGCAGPTQADFLLASLLVIGYFSKQIIGCTV